MDIESFKEQFSQLKSTEEIRLEHCDHPQCRGLKKPIRQIALKRNILKHGGKEFICRDCMMSFNNPMQNIGAEKRQTDELIIVQCNDPLHEGVRERQLKKSAYFGTLEQPYNQLCSSCVQRGKIISDEQRKAVGDALRGRPLSEEHRQKILNFRKNNPEWVKQANANLIAGAGSGWNKGIVTPAEVKEKISVSNKGKKRTLKQRLAISEGRKQMIQETGGFTREHRERISEATVRQYELGFNPKLYHVKGWHKSPKMTEPIFFRSSYEKKAYLLLDQDPWVSSYQAEAWRIKYLHPTKNITSTYLVDIKVNLIKGHPNGEVYYIEVKPKKLLEKPVTAAKIAAAKASGRWFEVWTEEDLFGPDAEKKIRAFVKELRKDLSRYEN